MVSLLSCLLGKGQLHPHYIFLKLPWLPSTNHIIRKKRTHNFPGHLRHSLSTRSLIYALAHCQRTWLSIPSLLLAAPSALPQMTSLPKTLLVSQSLASCHHLASSRRNGCRAGSRFVTSPFPDGTETRTHPPFTFRGLYDKSLLEEPTETKATNLPVWR